jgi:hypothetical protein
MAGSANKCLAVGRVERIVLIGCGGTGGFLAEHLCRMITGFSLECGLVLVDGDTVGAENIVRQNFAPHEIGINKAEALALRLSGRFGMAVEAIGSPLTKSGRRFAEQFGVARGTLWITATDSLISRRFLAELEPEFWLDVGNDKTYGQAVIGTTHKPQALGTVYRGWNFAKGYIRALPDMAAVNPAVLKVRRQAPRRLSCGQMPFAEQGFGVNAMAAQAAALLAKEAVVVGVIKTAAVFFDAAEGRMAPRLIDRNWFYRWRRQ